MRLKSDIVIHLDNKYTSPPRMKESTIVADEVRESANMTMKPAANIELYTNTPFIIRDRSIKSLLVLRFLI